MGGATAKGTRASEATYRMTEFWMLTWPIAGRTAEVARVGDILKEEMARLTREPVKDDELKLAKDYLIGSFPLRLDTTAKVADFIVAIEEQGLGLDYADRYKASIAKVTAADVQRVAQKYFTPDAFNQVVVGATK